MVNAPTWPGSAGSSIQELIDKLRKDGKADPEDKKFAQTPYSLQVIKAGATNLTQLWAVLVAAAGGGPALVALFRSLGNDFNTTEPIVRTAFIVSGSVLLSTVVLAIAIIVRGDVAGRALAAAAQKQAEASIAVAALSSYQHAQETPPPIGPYLVKKKDGTVLKVESFSVDNGNFHVYAGGTCINNRDIDYIIDSRSVMVEA